MNRHAILPMVELDAAAKKPPKLPDARRYLPATRAWYANWTKAPQTSQFTITDWQRLHMLALLVDAYFRDPKPSLLGEIRLNESKLGATAEDRLRLRWRFSEPEQPEARAGKGGSRSKADPRLRLVEPAR